KVRFELEQLKAELEAERSAEGRESGPWNEDVHRPIRDIEVRPKPDASLFAKLVEKESKRSQGRPKETMPANPETAADPSTPDGEAAGGPTPNAAFLERLFDREHYGLDDWAAGRVECGFLSDLDLVLDTIRGRFPGRGLLPAAVASWLECPQPSGYRAIHLTLHVPISRVASPNEIALLKDSLPKGEN